MRILFMGTPDFAEVSLETIYNAGYKILGVVTNPDKPKGRGMKMIASPVKEFAIQKDIPVYQPLKVRNNTEFIDAYSISVPDWKRESTDESIVYGAGSKAFIAILYKNEVYSNAYINKYNKSNNKKMTINSFNVEYEDGNVYYYGQDYRYVSYYINSDITLKIIGIADERNIKELNETVKAMVDSLMKDYITE